MFWTVVVHPIRRGIILIRGSLVVIYFGLRAGGRWCWIREETVEHSLGHRCFCGVKQIANNKAYKLYYDTLSGHGRLENYSKIPRAGECTR